MMRDLAKPSNLAASASTTGARSVKASTRSCINSGGGKDDTRTTAYGSWLVVFGEFNIVLYCCSYIYEAKE